MARRRIRSTIIAAIGAATLTAALLAPAADAASATSIPVVSAHISATSVSLSRTHLSPGRVTFDIHSSKGAQTLQIAKLHAGYTFAQANKDIGAGFGGDAAAIRRADANVTFYGGAQGSPKKTGHLTISLSAGSYVATVNNAVKPFTVSGTLVRRPEPAHSSVITLQTYGFDALSSIPRSGVMKLGNVSDQPHFLVMLHVKASTTKSQLLAAFSSNAKPTFALAGEFDSGVLTPYHTQWATYDLPAGKYVIACFWPDEKTGMVHAAMGMYRFITLT